MVDTDFLALIERGAEAWNRWRAENPDVKPDLQSAYLFNQELSGYNLREVSLERACLIGANLRSANLSKSCLKSAYASGADLSEANLAEADLSLSNFSEANFSGADLSGVEASGANLSQGCFTGACLSGLQTDAATQLSKIQGSYVYLKTRRRSKRFSKQRSPRQKAFKPGELAALIRRLHSLDASHQFSDRPWPIPVKWMIGLSSATVIALLGLTATFQSNTADPSTNSQMLDRSGAESVQGLDTVALPCKEVKITNTLISSASYQYKDGSIYYGALENGKPADGQGTMIYPSGNRYDGEYRDGDRNGCGTFNFSNGRRYIGQFEADQFSGKGTWILETGERYIGEFKNNQCSGKGTFIFFNGSTKSGIWENGQLLNDDLSCDRGMLDLPLSVYQ